MRLPRVGEGFVKAVAFIYLFIFASFLVYTCRPGAATEGEKEAIGVPERHATESCQGQRHEPWVGELRTIFIRVVKTMLTADFS